MLINFLLNIFLLYSLFLYSCILVFLYFIFLFLVFLYFNFQLCCFYIHSWQGDQPASNRGYHTTQPTWVDIRRETPREPYHNAHNQDIRYQGYIISRNTIPRVIQSFNIAIRLPCMVKVYNAWFHFEPQTPIGHVKLETTRNHVKDTKNHVKEHL